MSGWGRAGRLVTGRKGPGRLVDTETIIGLKEMLAWPATMDGRSS
jgi:hypothetical protein